MIEYVQWNLKKADRQTDKQTDGSTQVVLRGRLLERA
jgi:hypothetical protein